MRHLAPPFRPQEFSDPEVKAPSRLSLDKDVRELRAAVSRDVTGEELTQLTCRSNTNHAYWATASSLEDARFLVGLSYDAGLKLGFSMSPIWLEVSEPINLPPSRIHIHPPILSPSLAWSKKFTCGIWSVGVAPSRARSPVGTCNCNLDPPLPGSQEWETSRICAAEQVLCLELHSACASNQGRSHFQLILPHPEHEVKVHDQIVVLRRIQCHYNPVWVNGQARSRVEDLPMAFRRYFGLP